MKIWSDTEIIAALKKAGKSFVRKEMGVGYARMKRIIKEHPEVDVRLRCIQLTESQAYTSQLELKVRDQRDEINRLLAKVAILEKRLARKE